MKLKLGFIGTGGMGRSHIRTIMESLADLAEPVALYDPHPPSAAAATELAPGVRVCESEQELLGTDVDAVFISSPNCLHVSQAIAALDAGKHVYTEKPVAHSREDCLRLVEAASKTDRVLLVGLELRYSLYFGRIKELVAGGRIGVPRLFWCKEFRAPFLNKVGDWIQDSRLSGGALTEKNCHHFDLMNWWADSRPTRVFAFGAKDVVEVIGGPEEVIDNAVVTFEYDSGARGCLMLCMFAPNRHWACLELGIIGDSGMIQTKMETGEILLWQRDAAVVVEPTVERLTDRDGELAGHTGFLEAHEAFFTAIATGGRVLTNVRDCVHGTLLAIAAEEAIRTGQPVAV